MTNDVEANKILLGERGVPISPKIQDAIKPLVGNSFENEDAMSRKAAGAPRTPLK